MKKIVGLLLAIVLCVCILPINTFAQKKHNKNDIGEKNTEKQKRYTVLVLDNSGSMEGTPLEYLKDAAVKFCNTVLTDDSFENYLAVVVYTVKV